MKDFTKIAWAHWTFNPWRGCTKVAAGCANCYADALSKRNPGVMGVWGPNGTRVVASEAMWREPVKWNREAATCERMNSKHFPGLKHERPRVFCASLADVFEDWPNSVRKANGEIFMADRGAGYESAANLDDVRARLFRLIDATPNLEWLLLTKRPENVRRMIPWLSNGEGESSPSFHAWQRRPNVWLGTSIACQEDADRSVPELLKCRDLCAKTFLSIEPLIGPVNLTRLDVNRDAPHYDCLHGCDELGMTRRGPKVDWVIVGGESGPNARPCNVEWIRSIVRQCQAAGVPCFVKQWGSNPHYTNHQGDSHSCGPIRDPKGGDMAEWPEDIRVREVPS